MRIDAPSGSGAILSGSFHGIIDRAITADSASVAINDKDGNPIETTYARNDAVVHLSGSENISGTKTFSKIKVAQFDDIEDNQSTLQSTLDEKITYPISGSTGQVLKRTSTGGVEWGDVEVTAIDTELDENSTRPVQNRAIALGIKSASLELSSSIATKADDDKVLHLSSSVGQNINSDVTFNKNVTISGPFNLKFNTGSLGSTLETITGNIALKQDISSSLLTTTNKTIVGAINELDTEVGQNTGEINTIKGKIPIQASSQNQLADKNFVNSSINAMAAYYITSNVNGDAFATKAALLTGPYYNQGQIRVLTRNDYALVIADESHENASVRYMFDGTNWTYQYKVNDTPFTSAQLAAINSGITSGSVALIPTSQEKATWNAKQDATDNALQTTSKQIVGAINEVNGKVADALEYTITANEGEYVVSQTSNQKAHNIPIYQKLIAGTINSTKVIASQSTDGMGTMTYIGETFQAAVVFNVLYLSVSGTMGSDLLWAIAIAINPSTYELTSGADGFYAEFLESVANKVTSLSSSSTDTQYPSAKCVYDSLALKEDKTFYVDFTQDPNTEQWSANKTLAEIADAVNAGKVVMGRRVSEGPAGDVIVDCPLIMSMIGDDGGNVFFGTTYSANFGMAYITFMVSNEGGGSSDVVLAYEGNADNLFITKPSSSGTNGQVLTTNGSGTYTWTNKTEVVNDTTHTDTDKALSANMGKELQTQVNNLKNIGRFLAIWDASTGSPTSEPTTSPYTYKVGDYYRVGVAGTKNPASNLTYVTGGVNWQTGDALEIGDVVYCSNVTASATTWVRQASSGGGAVQDVQVGGVSVLSSGIANVPLASSSANGAMSSTDKSKLDGIESGADVTDATNVAAAGAVMTTAQSLTTEQKTQARSNIGAGTPIAIHILEGGDV